MKNQHKYQNSDAEFLRAIRVSKTPADVFRILGLSYNSYKSFWVRCEKLGVDTSCFETKTKTDSLKRKSISDRDIINACSVNKSRQSTLRSFGLNQKTGSNVSWISKKIDTLNICTKHWTGQGHLRGKTHNWAPKIPLSDILINNSTYNNTGSLKSRLLKEGVLKNKCNRCGILDWLNEQLSLHLDHKNGNYRDNRIENIRLLCPNCHSLTPTYCRGQMKK